MKEPQKTTYTLEDYLKAHITLSCSSHHNGIVPLGKLAKKLDNTPGTVTVMVKRFAEGGWMEYFPRKGCSLTDKGRELALSILRKHRIVESFLVSSLGMEWDEVHEEAEVIEHAISDKVLEKLDHFLGHPEKDPHGKIIPRRQEDLDHIEVFTEENKL